LAILLNRLGKREEAIAELQRMLQANPDFVLTRQQLQILEANPSTP
jgi:hypothetical protein